MNSGPEPLGYLTPGPLRPDAVLIGTSRKFALALLLGGSGAVGIGAFWLLSFRYGYTIEWAFVLFGAIFFVAGLWGLFDKKPRLIVDDDGFTDCKYRLGRVTWDQITRLRTGVFNGMTYLYVKFADNEISERRRAFELVRPPDAEALEATIPIGACAIAPEALIQLMAKRMVK